MTEESICMRCAELIRVKVKNGEGKINEERTCSVEYVEDNILTRYDDTVLECSRYVEVPGDKPKKK